MAAINDAAAAWTARVVKSARRCMAARVQRVALILSSSSGPNLSV